MCNDEYFTVVASHDRDQACSVTSSHPSWSSFMHGGTAEGDEERPIIEDIDMLMHILRHCRIDREKREAVENYLEHAIDLAALQNEMHEIMSLFVFQASRRQLLGHFMKKYEETVEDLARQESLELRLRRDALGAAIKHAEEEIRKLAYWSDVKKMAENGEFLAPGESSNAWQGLDQSSPCPPCFA
ncbi:hypothetical protein ESCO_005061 [Escovopsis weberi]|uniref:Uncharacterized protein n=1 Tax=Escovopsis weberi TaxID=150374 RepID=A0A0M9VW18_ESCWE|nr:hypothetical protein ESCO_005061 [Escovopsis weberi]